MTTMMIYITTANADEAARLAEALVEKRLAACVNILPGVRSVYRWQGRIEHAAEVALIAKTTEEKVPALTAEVRRLHSYECPCVVAVPIAGGAAPFLEWVAREVEG